MKKRKSLTPSEAVVVVAEWQRPKGERPTQEDLASCFNVSPVTIRRALAEAGLMKLVGYKTVKESALLEFLESQGLNDIDTLRKFIVKARNNSRGKQNKA